MKQYSLLLSACIAVGLSSYFSISTLGGYSQSEFSALYSTALTPIAFTFSIWSLIYISWFVLGGLHALKKIEVDNSNIFLLIFAQILSSFWLIPSQSLLIGLSFIVMIGVFASLSLLFLSSRNESRAFRMITDFFYGWILVAFLANMHQVLVAWNIYFFPLIFSIVSLIIGATYNIYLLKKYSTPITSFVFMWALFGIYLNPELHSIVQYTALLLILNFVVLISLQYQKNISHSLSKIQKKVK